MATASIHFGVFGPAWRSLRQKLGGYHSPKSECEHLRSIWQRLKGERAGALLEGYRYCLGACLEPALLEAVERIRWMRKDGKVPHRIPLGLLLVSRQQLTTRQLHAGLEAQRVAGRGRLGEWLVELGFVTEDKITGALARQWSCPVLRPGSSLPRLSRLPQLPLTLLERAAMIPVDYVKASSTLHVAFGDGVNHKLLCAIERMTGFHTEPCIAASTFVQTHLRRLLTRRGDHEVAFEGPIDAAECSRIIRSYCVRVSASEIRLADCNSYLWVRLFRPSRPALDLLMRGVSAPQSAPTNAFMAPDADQQSRVIAGSNHELRFPKGR